MSAPVTLAALFALTVLAPLVGIGPFIRRQAHAENNILYPSAPAGDLVLEAHEVIEWWCGWLAGCLAALPLAVVLPGWLGAAATLLAAFLGNAVARIASLHFDYVGHNVSAHLRGDREAEITRMIGRGDQRGMTRAEVARKLRQWAWLARFALFAFRGRYS